MGTSRFASQVTGTHRTARALLYSGREDPVWEVDTATGRALLRIWQSLTPADTRPTGPPARLGYRGVVIDDFAGARWIAAAGLVTCLTAAVAETRRDPGQRFERRVLASAPEGLLPAVMRQALASD